MSAVLLVANATVTTAHSRTKDLPAACRNADILVAAVGRTEMVMADWVKPGAAVIDVGINRVPAPEKGEGSFRLVGDGAFTECGEVAGIITPVLGSIGSMTIALLMSNTVIAAFRGAGQTPPKFRLEQGPSEKELPKRESTEFDAVIVGASPAVLAAAIRLKQVNPDLTILVLKKVVEVVAHILSGAVVHLAGSVRLPNIIMAALMNDHNDYNVWLDNDCRWLATEAEEHGVEIYPGFGTAEVLYDENGAVRGVATGDMGSSAYARGIELLGKYTLIGEGVRGTLGNQLSSSSSSMRAKRHRNPASAPRNSAGQAGETIRVWSSKAAAGCSRARPVACS